MSKQSDLALRQWQELGKAVVEGMTAWAHEVAHEMPMLWLLNKRDPADICRARLCKNPIVIEENLRKVCEDYGLLERGRTLRPGPDERPDLYYNDPGEDGAPVWRGHPIGPLAFPRPGHGVVVDDIDEPQGGDATDGLVRRDVCRVREARSSPGTAGGLPGTRSGLVRECCKVGIRFSRSNDQGTREEDLWRSRVNTTTSRATGG